LVVSQTSLKIKNLFPLVRGNFEFKPAGVADLFKKGTLMPMSADLIILDGVAEHYPPPRVKKEMPGIDKLTFTRVSDGADRLVAMGLDGKVQGWFRSLPQSINLQSMLRGAPVEEDRARAIFLALFFTDIITLPAGKENFLFGRAYLDDKDLMKLPEKAPDKKPEAAPVEVKKKEEPKLPIEDMLDKDMSDKELLAEIEKLLKLATDKEKTYFDLLGVEEKTSTRKIKAIYFKFAKKFHPDARHGFYVGDVRDQVETLFSKITEAHDTLNDSEARSNYVNMLKSRVSTEEMEMAQRAIEAEMEFQKAEIMIKKGAWKQGKEIIERAIKLQPEEPEYKMHLAWADYKIKGPSEASRAKRTIKEVLDKRPKAIDGHYFLGMIAKAEGDIDDAEKHLQEVAKKRPHDIEVKRELQLIARKRMAPAPKKKGGLFGKKK